MTPPPIHRGLGFLENYRMGNQDFLAKMMAVDHIGGFSGIIVMYGFCSSNALYSASL